MFAAACVPVNSLDARRNDACRAWTDAVYHSVQLKNGMIAVDVETPEVWKKILVNRLSFSMPGDTHRLYDRWRTEAKMSGDHFRDVSRNNELLV